MPGSTDRWGLTTLGSGDSIAADGYKFADADRHLIDRLLRYAAEEHRHTGQVGSDTTPEVGPTLTLVPGGGAMPASARYYYRFTTIDILGNESAGSPIVAIDTPGSLSVPGAPALSYVTGSGALEPGTYSYVLSAYSGASTLETKAINSAAITVPGTSTTNSVSLILPTLPISATGLNVYRKSASGMHYLYLASIAAPTVGQVWVDDGSLEGDCDRSLPATNHTNNTSAVRVSYPGATPAITEGWAWRIYRSTSAYEWSRSYLADLNPIGATPYTPVEYLDVGGGTETGAPPTVAQVINAPAKITLTDAAEVQGVLPPGLIVTPHMVTFTAPGPVVTGSGTFVWVCDYDQADILACRAYLGVDSWPAAQDVIVDVNLLRPAREGTWISAYDDGPSRPTVPRYEAVGAPTTPVHQHLVAGDAVCVDIDQSGGGATPTDANLTVNLLLYVQDGSQTTTYDWTT